MGKEAIRTELLRHIACKNYVNIEGETSTGSRDCIPVAIGGDMLMVLRFYDFEPHGYEVFPVDRIVSIKYSETDAYFEDIVKKEGAEALIWEAPDIDLQNWQSVFSFFGASGENIVVNIGAEDCVNIGRVISAGGEEVQMRCFGPTGVWDDEDWVEPYENITGIQLRNHYIAMFTKYMAT